MPDNEKSAEPTAPKFGDIAAELVRARTRAGLSHSELHRLTGISRSVLFGYENGRTKPGAKEIRQLCDALKVTPNRLIYGSDDFLFEKNTGWLDLDTDTRGMLNIATLIAMLSKEERSALLTLTSSILEARHGKKQFKEIFHTIGLVGAALEKEGFISQDKMNAAITEIEKTLPPAPPRPKKRSK